MLYCTIGFSLYVLHRAGSTGCCQKACCMPGALYSYVCGANTSLALVVPCCSVLGMLGMGRNGSTSILALRLQLAGVLRFTWGY